jgi:hypothetical protein
MSRNCLFTFCAFLSLIVSISLNIYVCCTLHTQGSCLSAQIFIKSCQMKFDILSASVFHCVRKVILSLVMKLEVQRMSLCVAYIIQNSIFVTYNTIQVGEITNVIYIDINHSLLIVDPDGLMLLML